MPDYQVQVTDKELTFPDKCACCGATADSKHYTSFDKIITDTN